MKYRCDKGHEVDTGLGQAWTTFAYQQTVDGEQKTYNYNYCMRCFGEWAVANMPLREVPPDV